MAKGRIDMHRHVVEAHRDAERTAQAAKRGSLHASLKQGHPGPGRELPVKGVAGKSAEVAIKGKARGRS